MKKKKKFNKLDRVDKVILDAQKEAFDKIELPKSLKNKVKVVVTDTGIILSLIKKKKNKKK